ncbi:MAG: acyltransferase [Methylobacter sp.]|uniref:acyltransferase family protein n=1 Tax=Methylobacter sp. TaxID=2051955 RepID=UPI00259015C3|nr:acyltransferase [Methylobacter sp.]MCL7422614.1 acyltransferase [Methylobacter sp.]
MSERSAWVDYAKAIGVFLLVYGHVARGVFHAGIQIDETLYRLTDSIIYSFHMPLFFFLSGLFFCGSLNKRGPTGVFASKVDTIVYPYLLWSILQGTLEASLSSHTNSNISYSDVFALLWQPRAQFWFLYALFMIFTLATLVFSKAPDKLALPVFAASICAYIFQADIPSAFHLNFITNNFVFFVFGILLRRWSESDWLASKYLLLAAFAGFIGSQYLFHGILGLSYVHKGGLSLWVALASILFIVALSKNLAKKPAAWFRLIGSSSMAIYLMHILAGSGTRIVLMDIFNVNSSSVHLAAGCVIGIAAPLLIAQLISRYRIPFVFSLPISRFTYDCYSRLFRKNAGASVPD